MASATSCMRQAMIKVIPIRSRFSSFHHCKQLQRKRVSDNTAFDRRKSEPTPIFQ
ncbi:hypothetical protein CPter91_2220 [Collimonas pratensis]|uniref:Uncharacterized protein n=1 Tax=Collimonas pratensis TaxID=279113 RepID=A0A127Q3M0_9BURK|nr:hypothetical protein CPter91_2220 [Collimonas pratensis]